MSAFEDLKSYVGYVVDDALNGWKLGEDLQYAVIKPASVLVCWQCGYEPMCVAVNSYLDGEDNPDWIEDQDAEELATDYLEEIGWLTDGRECDRIVRSYQ